MLIATSVFTGLSRIQQNVWVQTAKRQLLTIYMTDFYKWIKN
jgi:hypothetical protein